MAILPRGKVQWPSESFFGRVTQCVFEALDSGCWMAKAEFIARMDVDQREPP